jgi:hypothetical protein
MKCIKCESKNLQLLHEQYHSGKFCNDCGTFQIDITEGACCERENKISVRFEQSGGSLVHKKACTNCKQVFGKPIKKDFDFDTFPFYSQDAFKKNQNERNQSRDLLYKALENLKKEFNEKKSNEWWNDYNQYLQTYKWQLIRKRVLEREKNICQGCGIAKANHVHHTTYENLGDELLFQLIALCLPCHNKLHPDKTL